MRTHPERTLFALLLGVVLLAAPAWAQAPAGSAESEVRVTSPEGASPPAPPAAPPRPAAPPAAPPAAAPVAAPAPAAPQAWPYPWPPKAAVKGCKELRLNQTTSFAFPGVPEAGVSRNLIGRPDLIFGGQFGMGFCLTDLVELGGSLGVTVYSVTNILTIGVPFEAFLKLNFGARTSRWNPFAEVSLGGLGLFGTGTPPVVGTFGLRGGLEIFVRGAWAFYVSPGIQLYGAGGGLALFFRLGWGISAYF